MDLNADVGEECGDDAALFEIVTSASVAAGGHAGGGAVLRETVRLAAGAGVAVGAHPSYPDRSAFGRVSRAHDHDAYGIAAFVREQVVTVAQTCHAHGASLAHVKAHGALYNDIATDSDLARATLDGVRAAADILGRTSLPVMGMPGSVLDDLCHRLGIEFLAEAFADRAYRADGSLVPRAEPGAVLHDADAVAQRVMRIATEGVVEAVDGSIVSVPVVTVCLHGDTPGAVEIARRVRARLEAEGVRIQPIGTGR
jgi:5-oxoprolinase (ATP-hydrolysing) subunit A